MAGGERMENDLMKDCEKMTKRLIAQVMEEKDLAAISPEMISEIRDCVLALYH